MRMHNVMRPHAWCGEVCERRQVRPKPDSETVPCRGPSFKGSRADVANPRTARCGVMLARRGQTIRPTKSAKERSGEPGERISDPPRRALSLCALCLVLARVQGWTLRIDFEFSGMAQRGHRREGGDRVLGCTVGWHGCTPSFAFWTMPSRRRPYIRSKRDGPCRHIA